MIIIGHRGARGEAPENTLEGFRYLRSLAIHRVELDLRLSSDNQLAVIHDDSIDRTTDSSGKVAGMTAKALGRLEAFGDFPNGGNKEGRGIPVLAQVLAEWPELQSIQLEIKSPRAEDLNLIADQLNLLIRRYNLLSKAIVTSSDTRLLQTMQTRYSDIKRGYIAERFRRNPLSLARQFNCAYLVINWHRCNRRLVNKAHAYGFNVSAWTVNSAAIARKLKRQGVDSIITDVPSRLKTI